MRGFFSPKVRVLNEPRYLASPIRTITRYWSPSLSTARTLRERRSLWHFLRLTSPEMGPYSKFQTRKGTRGKERVKNSRACRPRSRAYSGTARVFCFGSLSVAARELPYERQSPPGIYRSPYP